MKFGRDILNTLPFNSCDFSEHSCHKAANKILSTCSTPLNTFGKIRYIWYPQKVKSDCVAWKSAQWVVFHLGMYQYYVHILHIYRSNSLQFGASDLHTAGNAVWHLWVLAVLFRCRYESTLRAYLTFWKEECFRKRWVPRHGVYCWQCFISSRLTVRMCRTRRNGADLDSMEWRKDGRKKNKRCWSEMKARVIGKT